MISTLDSGKYQVRVLLVLDRPTLIELIKLTLNHGAYTIRTIATAAVETSVAEWQPQLLVLDMDLDGTQIIVLVSRKMLAHGHLPEYSWVRRASVLRKRDAQPSSPVTNQRGSDTSLAAQGSGDVP